MKTFWLLLILGGCQYATGFDCDDCEKTLVSVYYESLCSDSREFIENQLVPAVQIFHDQISLELWPFGKAHSVKKGRQDFHCQHGQPECLGNRVQDCTLHYMQHRTDIEKVSYVNCEMTEMTGSKGDWTCVENAQVPLDLVQHCVYSDEGKQLQLISEEATKQLQPGFIPTITINNVFDQEIQEKCLKDLVGTLCSILEDKSPCTEHSNHYVVV